MKKYYIYPILLASLVVTSLAPAQTVTVAASGGDFTTISAAIANFNPDPDGVAPNVIQITDSGVYDEAITIDVPVTIEGTNTGAARPVIAAQLTTGGDGMIVTIAAPGDVTLRNLIIIPSLTSTPTDDLVRPQAPGTNMLIEDVVITANDGSDGPVTLDGLTEVDLTGATPVGDDGIFANGDGSTYTMRNVVISHNNNGAGGGDGLVCSGGGGGGVINYNILEGCVFSYNGRLGIQGNNGIVIDGSAGERVKVIGNKGFAGVWYAGGDPTVARTLTDIDILDNAGFGMEFQNHEAPTASLSNAIIAGNDGQGILVSDVGTAGTVTLDITNVTCINNTGVGLELGTGGTEVVSINASNLIVGSNGTAEAVLHNNTGAVAIDDSAIVTSGPYAGTVDVAGTGAGSVAQTNVINDDPQFVEVNDFQSSFYFQVSNATYQGAGPAAADLVGGGTFGSGPPSAKIWNEYE